MATVGLPMGVFMEILVTVAPHTGSRGSCDGRSTHGSHGGGGRGTSSTSRFDQKCAHYGSLGHYEP